MEPAHSEVASRFPRNCSLSQPVSKAWKLPKNRFAAYLLVREWSFRSSGTSPPRSGTAGAFQNRGCSGTRNVFQNTCHEDSSVVPEQPLFWNRGRVLEQFRVPEPLYGSWITVCFYILDLDERFHT